MRYMDRMVIPNTTQYKNASSIVKSAIGLHMYSHYTDSNNQNDEGFLYLIQEREFIRSNESVYKFGRTQNVTKRLSQYPNNSKLWFSINTKAMRKSEKVLLNILKQQFKLRNDIGWEYFEGDKDAIAECIQNYVNNEQNPLHCVENNSAPITKC